MNSPLSVIPCRGYSAPFCGDIENINSTWVPYGKMKKHQDNLPRQSVPALAQTMDRFLKSVRCLLDDEQYQLAIKVGFYDKKIHAVVECHYGEVYLCV
jgi:hypothetical protein